jgi:hypothetical protein
MTGRPRGPPRGGPPGPASGPRPPIGGAPPRGDDGLVGLCERKKQENTQMRDMVRSTSKEGYKHPQRPKNGPLLGPTAGRAPSALFGGPPGHHYRPLLNLPYIDIAPSETGPPTNGPPGGRLQKGSIVRREGGHQGAPRGVPPREGPPDAAGGPRGATGTPPGPPPGAPPAPPPGRPPRRGCRGGRAGRRMRVVGGGQKEAARRARRGACCMVLHMETKHKNEGETWCDRPQKRGKNTHKGLNLGPFRAPLQGALPVRFWGGPPAPPIDHC